MKSRRTDYIIQIFQQENFISILKADIRKLLRPENLIHLYLNYSESVLIKMYL